ncbi:hypothetical protein ARMGADRAFT_1037033 [Armillaria gallica]|uniref:Uncharacterized protein n=1 Tax=Armillaria gallica TaxID=47427 RepID=A0A2H3CN75_ARMGA|nr:hypothetical protein ARMGADRAFT_1037033 [Armillaria gallica]
MDYSEAELWVTDLAKFGSDVKGCLHTHNLGPGSLAICLVPKMHDTARRSRIIIVASDVHYWTTSEKELVKWLNTLAKLSNKFKECCTPAITKWQYFDSKCTASTTRHDLAFVQCLMCFSCGASDDVSLPPRTIAVNPGFCVSNLRSTLHEGYQEANTKQEAELAFIGGNTRFRMKGWAFWKASTPKLRMWFVSILRTGNTKYCYNHSAKATYQSWDCLL